MIMIAFLLSGCAVTSEKNHSLRWTLFNCCSVNVSTLTVCYNCLHNYTLTVSLTFNSVSIYFDKLTVESVVRFKSRLLFA